MSNDIEIYETDYFDIGSCGYKAAISYTLDKDGEGSTQAYVESCSIEITGEFTGNVWAKVDKEYFGPIQAELQRILEEQWASDNEPDYSRSEVNKFGKAA